MRMIAVGGPEVPAARVSRSVSLSRAVASAAAAVIWRPEVESSDGSFSSNDTLFVMGGFGGWPESDSRYNGMRCRNDVYKTKDGGKRQYVGSTVHHSRQQ